MDKQWRDGMERIIDQLIAIFGLKPRLMWDNFFGEMEKLFNEGSFEECVLRIKEQFGMPGIRVKPCFLGPMDLTELFRFTWVDRLRDFFRVVTEQPQTRDFGKPVWRGTYFLDKDAEPPVMVVELVIRSWLKRVPFAVFASLVAKEITTLWLEEANELQLRLPGYKEIVPMLAGFDYLIMEGRSAGRYWFSTLGYGELLAIEDYINRLRADRGLRGKYNPY